MATRTVIEQPRCAVELFVLRALATRGAGSRLLSRMLSETPRLPEAPEAIDELLDPGAQLLEQRYRVQPEVAHALRADDAAVRRLWDEIQERRVRVLIRGDAWYPALLGSRCGDKAPPVLFALGDLGILSRPAVGFCGSRKASDKGLAVAAECAGLLAADGKNIVSGYAHGVDLAVHRAAMEKGVTTAVLAEGILGFRKKAEIKQLATERNLLVLSEFSPRLPWNVGNAMARNWTICGLSAAMVVIESGLEGGTFAAGNAALDLGIPLFAVDYADPPPAASGNAYFLAKGARRLRRHKSGEPNLQEILRAITEQPVRRPEIEQLGLPTP